MIDIAFAQQTAQGGPAGAFFVQLVFLIGIFAIFYFLMIRPQQKARKRHQEFLANLKKGDKVITSGGIWGTVVEIGEDTITLRVDANTRITFTKEAIVSYQPKAKEEKSEKSE
ncbi:MAG: preprotein translocase subunit YajC [Hydrogenobacter thermophilus]|uniref:Sec translocon accessory complex subunit YajC n=1 Tax=Hydrogenobacter thermophilus (strain DSM 6534 / IAM 12695 / TK-6) TaxID=608538 RepID=D3DJR8_HYDTT|nr:preprotein translocase subunit YajC [Hydrogenobacter thermophilus]ADO45993.1 preprotein translocase, YajC subunit [Hydrogenobacter thermophilus TK-6]MCS7285449.1 preprotein translocase subunit YajC [Hydrogenobacter thermophilus]QWK19126.1 MAG: preprotein translocase subunit YajC [Hydrogenobacter thermophilus]BAI70070.1 preprotein translocase YajC subunit [Hydrogenobacter thermophilus TK-6]